MTVKELREWLADKPDDIQVLCTVDGQEQDIEPVLASVMWADKPSTDVWDSTGWNKYCALMRNPERILV